MPATEHLLGLFVCRWRERIDAGQITYSSSGLPLKRDTLLAAGDKLTYSRAPSAEPEAPAYMHILYEDEHVVSSEQPRGQVPHTHTSPQRTGDPQTGTIVGAATHRHLSVARLSLSLTGSCWCPAVAAACATSGARLLLLPLPVPQLALCKPAGLQVLPKGLFMQRTVLGLLQQYTQQHRRLAYPRSLEPVPVHRLGRGTSGEHTDVVLLVALHN